LNNKRKKKKRENVSRDRARGDTARPEVSFLSPLARTLLRHM
jgi:hypothetical protein